MTTTGTTPKHLEPVTYWEQRCELLEESVYRLISILASTTLTPQGIQAVNEHVATWNKLLVQLDDRHQKKEPLTGI